MQKSNTLKRIRRYLKLAYDSLQKIEIKDKQLILSIIKDLVEKIK